MKGHYFRYFPKLEDFETGGRFHNTLIYFSKHKLRIIFQYGQLIRACLESDYRNNYSAHTELFNYILSCLGLYMSPNGHTDKLNLVETPTISQRQKAVVKSLLLRRYSGYIKIWPSSPTTAEQRRAIVVIH